MISKHISFKEATFSATAVRNKIINEPDETQLLAMKTVAGMCFEPLREWYGKPIKINSFFRCLELNKAVGGSQNSQHCKGETIDGSISSKYMKYNDTIGAFIIGILLTVLVLVVFKKCGHDSNYVEIEGIKKAYKQIEVGKFLKKDVQAKTDTVKKHRKTYHKSKEEIKTLPCDTALKLIVHVCDTLVKADSVLIEAQNKLILNQDSTITGLLEVHREDSTTIVKLNKKLKRQKVLTKAAFILGFGSGGFLGFKIKN